MEKLLKALKAERSDLVGLLAYEMFVNKDGSIDEKAVRAFESYARCKVIATEFRVFGIFVGVILYKGVKYRFG